MGTSESGISPRVARGLGAPEKISVDRFPEFLADCLDFAKWGFHQTHASPDQKTLIFDSPSCRLKCSLFVERYADEVRVAYGRKHAPNEGFIIEWAGERCRAWHNIRALHVPEFLDGLSVQQIVDLQRAHQEMPAAEEYIRMHPGSQNRAPAAGIATEQFLWERYGARLFDVFDARRADLWDNFRRFVHDYNALRTARSERYAASQQVFEVPVWKIC